MGDGARRLRLPAGPLARLLQPDGAFRPPPPPAPPAQPPKRKRKRNEQAAEPPKVLLAPPPPQTHPDCPSHVWRVPHTPTVTTTGGPRRQQQRGGVGGARARNAEPATWVDEGHE